MARMYYKHGCMKSNKSMELLTTAKKYEIQNKTILAFKPYIDYRSGEYITSRATDYKIKADALIKNGTIGLMKYLAATKKPNCILVDEIQFFNKKHIQELSDIALKLNIPVIGYGLLTDFQGNMFEGSKYMIEYSEKIEEIKTECFYCNRKAIRNLRLLNGEPIFHGKQIQIGDEEYNPCCIVCYNNFKENKTK